MTKTIQNTISVIIPTYNAAATIEDAVISIVTQTYQNIELLVMDGGSKDNTVSILEQLSNLYHFKYISEKDKGVYDAMNKGVQMATGDWLYFLGADDVLHDKDVINDLFAKNNYNDYDVIYGDVLLKTGKVIYGGVFNTARILQQNICHQGIFYKKEVFKKNGLYDMKYPMLADYVFNLKWFGQKDTRRSYVNRVVAIYAEEGMSTTKRDMVFKKDRTMLVKQYFNTYWYLYALLIVPFISKLKKSAIGKNNSK